MHHAQLHSGNEQRHVQFSSIIEGNPTSSGISRGKAHYLAESIGFDQIREAAITEIEPEIQRFSHALQVVEEKASRQLHEIDGYSKSDKTILEIHIMFLKDETFVDTVKELIRSGCSAEYSLKSVVSDYIDYFRSMKNSYLRDRENDIKNVGRWILQQLMEAPTPEEDRFDSPTIIIASDITPLRLESLRQPHLKGIVLTEGGVTSHATIFARSLEIPMVIGAKDAITSIRQNDDLILDGSSGLVLNTPPEEVRFEYERIEEEKRQRFQHLSSLKDKNVVSSDGYSFQLGINVGYASDTHLVHSYGADHIGLFRTEVPFLSKAEYPSEDEQTQFYSQVVSTANRKPITIRTLDAGGDKLFSPLEWPHESNPYLGVRGIRLSLRMEEVFRRQIRAVLRSAVLGPVKLLIPMVTSVDEIKAVSKIIEEEKSSLKRRGKEHDPDIPLGIMLEVPSTLFTLPQLLRYVDFISIGMNDLTQYMLAADRNNKDVASVYNPLHPAVLHAVRDAVETCRQFECPVSICGEAVSYPEPAGLLLATKPDALSVTPAAVPEIKEGILESHIGKQQQILEKALRCEDAGEVSALAHNASM
jgi:phosphotransferase system enzyme I (PtsP)